MATGTPSVGQFITAQKTLRGALGSLVTFHIPVAETWDAAVKINPDTKRPYDPTAVPLTTGFTDVQRTCLIVQKVARPANPVDDASSSALGYMENGDWILDLDSDDYADVHTATELTVSGQRCELTEFRPFEVASTPYRYLIYASEKD